MLLLVQQLAAQNRYSVVIDELMADPTPPVGLPAVEYIELKNVSGSNINLSGWRIADAGAQSGPLPAYILKPDSFLIVCSSSSLAQLLPFGPAVSVSGFPSLDNDGDIITLRSPSGMAIHTVAYTTAWYRNPAKAGGGWSLEMTDTRNPCGGAGNWKASTGALGGTPGKRNANDAPNPDTQPPRLTHTYTTGAGEVVAVFNEPLDSTTAARSASYRFSDGIPVLTALPLGPLFQQVRLTRGSVLQPGTIYRLTVNDVTDCAGNAIGAFNTARSGLPVEPDSLDIVVNELLFNPKPGGADYIEYYNRSARVFDAARLFMANRNSAGDVANIKKLSEQPFLVFPGDYITITENRERVLTDYWVKEPGWLLQAPALPPMNNDEGTVMILGLQGNIIEEVRYTEKWHFPLLGNTAGISLERLNPNAPAQAAANWHSSASSAGYGTPMAKNAQYITGESGDGIVTVMPKTFSPDNDGRDDVLNISYRLTEPGYTARVVVFNVAGWPVRQLANNQLLGISGSWNWNGLGDNNERLPMGIYIVWVEMFNLDGRRTNMKNAVVLSRPL